MSLIRAIICIIFPPLAVIDKGCGSILLVSLLTLAGWIPGVIAAMVVCASDSNKRYDRYSY
ncbi:MAG TPA: YqaE/Pmp3 family membrane protein [Chloroflexia bacterium]|nr:YqaE/Pmp3 family membrane protein [Chloroflexia bacterium]